MQIYDLMRREEDLPDDLRSNILSHFQEASDKMDFLNSLKTWLHQLSPITMPVDLVRWIPLDQVRANDYNPNKVASTEMNLLHHSIAADGFTQPVVAVKEPGDRFYTIVDGFHRFQVSHAADVRVRTHNRVPLVTINTDRPGRMAATVRHNRARGRHAIGGMSSLVFQMLEAGQTDADICNEIGCSPDELARMKHITGFSKLYAAEEYSPAWAKQPNVSWEVMRKNGDL